MHELAATESILTIALDAARIAGARRVRAVDVIVGELSSMLDESVQFYFEMLSRDTPAAGAQLRMRRSPARATCGRCGAVYEVALPLSPTCRECGAPGLAVAGGREFYVESIEVDE